MAEKGRMEATEPPFYRGERGDWGPLICDRLLDSGDACDGPAGYHVEWWPVPALDNDTLPISGCCEAHVVDVDRALVERMTSVRRAA